MNKKSKILKWLRFIIGISIFPFLLTSLLIWYAYNFKFDLALKDAVKKAAQPLKALTKMYDAEEFIASELEKISNNTKKVFKLKKRLRNFNKSLPGINIHFIIHDPQKNIFYSSRPMKAKNKREWIAVCKLLRQINVEHKFNRGNNIPPKKNKILRKKLGQYFIAKYSPLCHSKGKFKLLHTSSAKNAPLIWVKFVKKHLGLIIRVIPQKNIRDTVFLRYLLELGKQNTQIKYFVLKNGIPLQKKCAYLNEISKLKNILTNPFKNMCTTNKRVYLSRRLGNGYNAIAIINKKNGLNNRLNKSINIVLIILLSIVVIVSFLSYQHIVKDRLSIHSIKTKLIVLFSISAIIPSFLIVILGYDYLWQYKSSELSDMYLQGNLFLRHIDELFTTEKTRQIINIKKGGKFLKRSLCKSEVKAKPILEFLKMQTPRPFRLALVGSQTPFIGSELGIFKNRKLVYRFNKDNFQTDKHFTTIRQVAIKIGKYFLGKINSTPISKKTLTELEFTTEALGQKTSVNLIQKVFANLGNYFQMGFGVKKFPSFIDSYRLHDPKIVDYLLFYIWQPYSLQLGYIKRKQMAINRNPYGFRVFAYVNKFELTLPNNYRVNPFLIKYAKSLNEKNGTKPTKFVYNSELNYIFGFKCYHLDKIKLIGFFPEKLIDSKVNKLKKLIIAFAIINFITSLSFSLLVSRIILAPLNVLRNGVEQMKSRNFHFRIPQIGNNEFGDLAKIINETMNDLSEIETAGDFKEKIFGDVSKEFNFGNFKGFVSSINVAEFNGNYIDVFNVNKSIEGLLFGTVYTNGIASGLTTAYIKSCSIQLLELARYPRLFLERIYQLLERIHKQDKLPTLSYLTFDNSDNIVKFSATALKNIYITSRNKKTFNPTSDVCSDDCSSIVILSESLLKAFLNINANIENIIHSCQSDCIQTLNNNLNREIARYFPNCDIEKNNYLILLNTQQI